MLVPRLPAGSLGAIAITRTPSNGAAGTADAADRMGAMVSISPTTNDAEENIVLKTGTDDAQTRRKSLNRAQRVTQQSGRESERRGTAQRDGEGARRTGEDSQRKANESRKAVSKSGPRTRGAIRYNGVSALRSLSSIGRATDS